mmetsp:Transcript_13727/g.2197  ORF Transcript_13727/g.2197 Transcript_13727/m.2197 type:complete len:82 (+) Transcript_13727:1456-1701(+)|eukprot:CAMPEP_0168315382 /NCGR_PEP_ID=MMETSP0210-20121227/11033_1 /TAXON_ID=40633 /ORGANISM="Condylostoma magnum, Strain COL2" /LENGTH=81 /DNA_ID=CAMNT_0008288179 /DNA_START=1455 /DNA_END=1700 /DNA_ORIENTATION=+
MSDIAQSLINDKDIFVLGSGLSYSIAREGALKLKEITYAHAEGFHGGALAHGPYALLDKKTPAILLILDDEYKDLMNDTFQ